MFRFAAIYVHTPSQVYMFGDYWPIQWRWHQRVPVKKNMHITSINVNRQGTAVAVRAL